MDGELDLTRGLFKVIVLLNAHHLTVDAQSALRRCIELFSYNTRFFIVVENKQRLLNPILSRFCEIYVPDYIKDGTIVNLHQHTIEKKYKTVDMFSEVDQHMTNYWKQKDTLTHSDFIEISTQWYESGLSCLDLIQWIEKTELLTKRQKATYCMGFHAIKSEFRCEKLLLLYMFDFLFLRSNTDIKYITSM